MMFRRKKADGEGEAPGVLAPENLVAPVVIPATRTHTVPHTSIAQPSNPSFPNRMPAMPPRPTAPEIARPAEHLRRPVDLSTVPTPVAPPSRLEPELRQLIVGREITLQGEIKTCDLLLVEGSVEANLSNCREVVISETGLFKGKAEVDGIEIRGRFEGTLTVNGRLFIRAAGSVTGTIRYGQIEIECGGKVSGDVQSQTSGTPEMPEYRRDRASQSVVEIDPMRVG